MKYEILYLYNIMRKNKSPVHLTNIWLIWFLELTYYSLIFIKSKIIL